MENVGLFLNNRPTTLVVTVFNTGIYGFPQTCMSFIDFNVKFTLSSKYLSIFSEINFKNK